jgi:hypothetical protein
MHIKKGFLNASFYLYDQFKKSSPFATGKIGNCELMCIYNYYIYKQLNQPVQWAPNVVDEIYNNAGVFPQTEQARIDFIKEITNSLPYIDSIAWWSMFNMPFEASYIKSYAPNCELIEMQSLEPFYSGIPWTEHLENKNVLVISPFVDSIRQQYDKRHLIWKDQRILPTFKNLYTLKHSHSPGIDKPSKFNNWLDMIRHYKSLTDTIDYDVMLIGAGASSLPLVAHARKNGKKAVHLGGPLQLLFGIKGSRWDNGSIGSYFYNEHWIRPSGNELPEKYKNIEGGCYW